MNQLRKAKSRNPRRHAVLPRKYIKVVVTYVLLFAIVFSNMSNPLLNVFAGQKKEEFRIHADELQRAAEEALEEGNIVEEPLDFYTKDSSLLKEYEELFAADGTLYEIFPDYEREYYLDDIELRIFLRISPDADPDSYALTGEETLIFLYTNGGEETVAGRVNIDGYISGICSLKSYMTAFEKKEELDAYLHLLEEAAKRDHRKLGKELGLFVIKEEGPGFPFFLPKGMALRNELENFWREVHHEFEYEEIRTPIILNKQLWETSGHWFHYRENMYTTIIDEEEYAIKPMNCPGGILVYQNEMHSYRDFPLRYAELGLVHRHELSGALHGLFRVRAFTQDDAHVFMLPSQMQSELMKVIELFDRIYSQFGLKYHVELSTKPDNAMGDDAIWEAATEALRNAIEAKGIPYVINPGDGAFYGPKLDYHIEDSLGRTWQCGTIQLDMNLPERFQIEYVGEDGQKHRPIMIHRACFGSMERFIGILTEHYAGAFPTWMAPVQVKILPISEKHVEYAKDLAKQMHRDYVRVEVDDRSEKIGYKIRQAQMAKVPYMLVVGDKEVEEGTVNVRKHGGDELGSVPFEEFFNSIKTEIKERN